LDLHRPVLRLRWIHAGHDAFRFSGSRRDDFDADAVETLRANLSRTDDKSMSLVGNVLQRDLTKFSPLIN